jgi:hypothetical protein
MQLTSPKRVHESQDRLKSILHGVHGADDSSLSLHDANCLCSFHLDNKDQFNSNDKAKIGKDALYLHANKEPKASITASPSSKLAQRIIQLPSSKPALQNEMAWKQAMLHTMSRIVCLKEQIFAKQLKFS